MRPWGIKRLFSFPSRTRDEVRADVDDELAFHIEMRSTALEQEGLNRREAREQALAELGRTGGVFASLAAIGERHERKRRLGRWLDDVWRDVVIGCRLLRRSPGFAATAILTLALGIGANTAIYSVLDAVLLRPLPYPEPDRLVMVSETNDTGRENSVAGGVFLDWRTHATRFQAMTLIAPVRFNLRGNSASERLDGLEVSHEFFQVLGIPPFLGRGFQPDDDRPGGRNDVVVITEELWRSHFGGDRSIVGRRIVLDEIPRTVIGVLPSGTWLISTDSFFVPAVLTPGTPRAARAPHWATVIGRLSPGASVTAAETELKTVRRQLDKEYPAFKKDWSVMARPVAQVLGSLTRAPLLILLAAVSLVLLIACANVANLVMARSCHRQQELAVRAAIGASGGRLLRQLLTESLILALVGGAAGIVVAYAGLAVLKNVAAAAMPITFTPELDLRVLLCTLAVTLLIGPLCGLLPALRARRPNLNAVLTNGGRGATAGGHQRTQATLVVTEIALTVVLLSSSGLLLRSLGNAASIDPGFNPAHALAFDLSLAESSYGTDDKRLAFASAMLTRLRAVPGVAGAGTAMAIPFAGGGYGEYFSRPDVRTADPIIGRMDFVSPGYLEALGAQLRAGRTIANADNGAMRPRVAVISEATARMFYPRENPIGRPLIIAAETWTIVGVVGDIVDRRLDAPRGAFGYVPMAFNTSQLSVVVRTAVDPMALVGTIRRELERLDSGVALAMPRTLEDAMADSLLQRKVVLGLIGAFALAALTLATIGLYGVMAYAVATRQREFGIRIAFGAVRRDLIGHVLRGGLGMMAIGLAIGLAGALGTAQLLSSQLFQVGGDDPLVIGAVTATVLTVALLACWIPAWRASRYDAVVTLRAEG